MIAGCAQTVTGKARAVGAVDPGTVAGLPVSNGPSGPKSGVADAKLTVENGDGGDMDKLAVNTIADVQEYWAEQLPANFGGTKFTPVKRYVSYDSDAAGIEICKTSTAGLVNAMYCSLDDSVSWDRGQLLPMLTEKFGAISVVMVLAHELGHAVQTRLGELSNITQATPSIIREQQADCYAGNFFRWLAEGKSKHFQISTGDGLNKILTTMFFIKDNVGSNFTKQGAHGSAFDRVSAFQFGFTEGPKRCAKIDLPEYEKRKTEVPLDNQAINSGNLPVNDKQSRDLLESSLKATYEKSGANPPTLKDGSASCSDAKATPPASYCPSNNTISIDPDALNKIGTPPGKKGQSGGLGDFAAFAEISSRYALAVQKAAGLSLEGTSAGLRTACLTGSWGGAAKKGVGRVGTSALTLGAGDLDKAIAELLQDKSLIAADVNGKPVDSGFARVEAFRIGFLEGSDACSAKFN
ncbi:neutral zinc metallopeptidase [Solihabitans fulvus]|uniref:neutral zinc metallopeptidase n=1 Tax=Solihabitans fulvus TaxID=1892852 RepID=UPI001CB768B2|nr:neutral zinc metallopeptidase [Solihabitans fulvus]